MGNSMTLVALGMAVVLLVRPPSESLVSGSSFYLSQPVSVP